MSIWQKVRCDCHDNFPKHKNNNEFPNGKELTTSKDKMHPMQVCKSHIKCKFSFELNFYA
jgi:hypothetical protein